MAILKNIAQEQVLLLAQQVEAEAGQIVSKTLAQNDAVSITLFAFSKGEEPETEEQAFGRRHPALSNGLKLSVGAISGFVVAFVVMKIFLG